LFVRRAFCRLLVKRANGDKAGHWWFLKTKVTYRFTI
jgi:hypothetical protein